MELKLYLVRNKISITDFSVRIGCNRSYLSEIINGAKMPGKRLAKDIEEATNGEVTAKELLQVKNE